MQAHSGVSNSYYSSMLELQCVSFGNMRKLENETVDTVSKYLKVIEMKIHQFPFFTEYIHNKLRNVFVLEV